MRKWEQQMIVKDNCEPRTGIRKPAACGYAVVGREGQGGRSRQRSSLGKRITVHGKSGSKACGPSM